MKRRHRMKKIILIKCLEGCVNASGPVGAAPERMRPCPFRDRDMQYDPEEDKREIELKISYQKGKIDSLIQLLKDGAITLDGVYPDIDRAIEELNELYKYKENLMFGLEGI